MKTSAAAPSPPAAAPCAVCGRSLPEMELLPARMVRPSIAKLVARDCPHWNADSRICKDDLDRYRRQHLEELLEEERGELGTLEREVLDSFETGQLISQTPEDLLDEHATFGERLSDKVAAWGGSWTFIVSFTGVLLVWMALNISGLLFRPFDPYPFILLNLVRSTIAALQAPVIMMSQRRQEAKDRLRAENDYQVNLKAELEIRQLHEKLDHQIARQWEHLARLQQLQIEMLEDRRSEPAPK